MPSDLVKVLGAMLWFWLGRPLPLEYTYEEGLLPPAENPGGIGESSRCWTFLCLDLKLGFWQIKMKEASKQYTTFTVGNLGFFECNGMPFGLCNMLATFQRLMQNCLSELNLICCLIYLDNIIVFLQMVEEHLNRLCVVFDQFREYNLKLRPSKCSLFREEINYLVHQVSKEGVWPSNSNLKAIAKCAAPQTYMEIRAFLSLMGHYRQFIKGFACIAQPLNGLLRRGCE